MDDVDLKKKSLRWFPKVAFGVGHVFNDLCASMWFTYLLIFYEKVLEFDPTVAGLVLLVGQLADGISTPIVGIFSDKRNKIAVCARYGRRKVWHLLGTLLVALSFPFIYSPCLGCEDADDWSQFGYYALFVVLFQFGWACVQISHLALIPDLTSSKSQRTELSSIRYAFTVLANLAVFTVTFFVLKAGTVSGGEEGKDCGSNGVTMVPLEECSSTDNIGPEDTTKFRDVSLICVGMGLAFSILFHLGVREPPFIPPAKYDAEATSGQVTGATKMRKMDWFKEPQFYQIAVLYMATRLYVNLYQVYIPLYVDETLGLSETYVATVPFAMYLAGFLGSLLMKYVNKGLGRKRTFALGCVVGLGGCVWIWLGDKNHPYYTSWGIFLVAALLGIGGSTLLITSLSITADLIGSNVEGGAFVYGFMSLVDKFSNGIIIMIIQKFKSGEEWYYRSVITFACGSSCVLGILVTLTLMKVRVGTRRRGSDVIQIMEDDEEESSSNTDEKTGIDNPALTTISDGQLDIKPSTCQLRAEDTPAMCQLGLSDVPKLCQLGNSSDNTKDSRKASPAATSDHLDTKTSTFQLRAEDTPAMCQLGLSDVPKLCQLGNSSDNTKDSGKASPAATSDQLDTKPSTFQLRAEDTPAMCQLGLSDVPKLCQLGNSSDNTGKSQEKEENGEDLSCKL